MGALSAILFILGNILLFHPIPKPSQPTCYHTAPLLWWGVMTVTGVGWFLLVQVFVVVVVVGIGGQAVLVSRYLFRLNHQALLPHTDDSCQALLRSIGLVAAAPEITRKPPAAVLSLTEIHRIPEHVYLPKDSTASLPSTPKTVSSAQIETVQLPSTPPSHTSSLKQGYCSTPGQEQNPIIQNYDLSRLPHSPAYLDESKATCAICQENYVPPEETKAIMLRAESLRQLPCHHLFHVS